MYVQDTQVRGPAGTLSEHPDGLSRRARMGATTFGAIDRPGGASSFATKSASARLSVTTSAAAATAAASSRFARFRSSSSADRVYTLVVETQQESRQLGTRLDTCAPWLHG